MSALPQQIAEAIARESRLEQRAHLARVAADGQQPLQVVHRKRADAVGLQLAEELQLVAVFRADDGADVGAERRFEL